MTSVCGSRFRLKKKEERRRGYRSMSDDSTGRAVEAHCCAGPPGEEIGCWCWCWETECGEATLGEEMWSEEVKFVEVGGNCCCCCC